MAKIEVYSLVALFATFSILFPTQTHGSFPYYGTKIGPLKQLHHGVSGDLYAVDSRTIFIKNFNYDGDAPAAYFYVGNSKKPSNEGAYRLRDEHGSTTALKHRYRNKDITLSLPEGKTLRDIKWFSVWCDEFAVNFGDASIPSNLDFPRPQKIAPLQGVHEVQSDEIVIVDAQTLLVPNFSYDGEAPDAKFWVGRDARPTAEGLRIPDENGKVTPLRRYDKKTIVLTLPGDLTIFDIGHFGVWCEAFTVDFGHVRIPEGLNVPPSLKMLGISPQSKLNCEVLYDDLAFEVRWAVAGESIVFQLVSKLANGEYMSFGISPRKDRSVMIGSDVVAAWVDKETGKGYAHDYYLDDKSQCSGQRGACPDVNLEENTNSIRLLNAAMVNGYSIVTYQRSLHDTDKYDLPIPVNSSQAIVWAIGPLNERQECSYHSHYTERNHLIDFGRQPRWNCPMPEGIKTDTTSDEIVEDEENDDEQQSAYKESQISKYQDTEEEYYDNRAQALQGTSRRPESRPQPRPVPQPRPANTNDAWDIPPIQCYEPEDGVFYAQMGPTGGKHGYPAITGHVGWGISWYINGLLIPEIHVVRGKTYTFVVEGGNNPDIPAKFHPFYITDDPVGGFEHKRDEEKAAVRIFAGVHRSRSGKITPIGIGRLCNWTPDVDGPPADDFQSFGAYQRTLTLKCDEGEPGVINWMPDRKTPDTVYYHCFTHRHLGWKIHVHDSCDDESGAASDLHEVIAPVNAASADIKEDIDAESSIRHETKVSPNDNFLLKHQTDLIKNHNMNGSPPKLSFEITKSSEITKLISDGIRAAEALEESILRSKNVPADGPAITQTQSKQQQPQPQPQQPILVPPPPPAPVQLPSIVKPLPQKPYINSAPEILHGDTHVLQHYVLSNRTNPMPSGVFLPQQDAHLTASLANSQSIGLSEYLRPPQNSPLFRPVKLPGRRPYPAAATKGSAKKPLGVQPLKRQPVAIPQPSVIVNHYRKPVPGLLKAFLKDKPFPIKPIAASVLLLGQPTELKHHTEPILKSKPKPIIAVPYADLTPQESLQSYAFIFNGNVQKDKKPLYLSKIHQLPVDDNHISSPPSTVSSTFQKPFDVHEVKEDSVDIAALKPAINHGFQPDSVVVEGGFRPILRHRTDGSNTTEPNDQIARRREDPGSEIDEVMETDTLFLSQQQDIVQTQNFEPMFIPSPLDSTNATIVRKTTAGSSTTASVSALAGPAAAKLTRDPNVEDMLDDLESGADNANGDNNNDEIDDIELADGTDNDDDEDDNDPIGDDKLAQPAERIDTYYLPPDNHKVPHSAIPSGAVVTYDGKAVLDTSLISPPKLEGRDSSPLFKENRGLSKTEALVRNTPQFGPFRGEIPPLIPDFLSAENGSEVQPGVNPITEYSNPLISKGTRRTSSTPSSTALTHSSKPISTKLQILKDSA